MPAHACPRESGGGHPVITDWAMVHRRAGRAGSVVTGFRLSRPGGSPGRSAGIDRVFAIRPICDGHHIGARRAGVIFLTLPLTPCGNRQSTNHRGHTPCGRSIACCPNIGRLGHVKTFSDQARRSGFHLLDDVGDALAENRIALVIGNSTYTSVPALPNPANDAKAMTQFLNAAGFEVLQAPNLTQSDMRRTISDFASVVAAKGPDTVALVFYAGHGLQVDGENFLVPVDARIEREADVPLQAMRLADVMNALAAVPSKIAHRDARCLPQQSVLRDQQGDRPRPRDRRCARTARSSPMRPRPAPRRWTATAPTAPTRRRCSRSARSRGCRSSRRSSACASRSARRPTSSSCRGKAPR